MGQSCYHRYCRGLDGHLAYRAWVCADRPPDAVIPKRYADFAGCPCWPLTAVGTFLITYLLWASALELLLAMIASEHFEAHVLQFWDVFFKATRSRV